MKIIPSIVTLLFLIAAGTVSSPAQNATTVEPLLVYKALQDKDCRHWVDSVMDKLSFKEKVGQLFIYTIAPVDTKRNLELLREVFPGNGIEKLNPAFVAPFVYIPYIPTIYSPK